MIMPIHHQVKLIILCVVAPLSACDSCAGEADKCLYNGESYAVGEDWQASDGCNSCLCLADGEITCTAVGCGPTDAGSQDAGSHDVVGTDAADDAGRDGGVDDLGAADTTGGIDAPATNEIVPYPQQRCAVTTRAGATLSQPVAPGTQVVMDQSALPAPPPGAVLSQIEWSVARAPVSNRVGIDSEGVYFPQVDGDHVLHAVLTFDSGSSVTYDCWLEVRGDQALTFELSWNLNQTDLDIHLIKQSSDGRFCLAQDSNIEAQSTDLAENCDGANRDLHCYYASCRGQNSSLDWDGDQSVNSAGDPVLLQDVTQGYGPEVVQLRAAGPGSYLLAGYSYGSDGGRRPLATLRLFSQGQLRGEVRQELAGHSWWEGFVIDWPAVSDGDVCVTERASGVQHCGPAPQCVTPAATCDQCVDDSTCGSGTRCAQELQRCVSSAAPCQGQAWCDSGLACVPATDRCAETECTSNEQCPPPMTCTLDTLACTEQPAVCDEVNEPNNSIAEATPVQDNALDDVLCRGDVDLLEIPVRAGMRHSVVVTSAPPGGNVMELLVELLDAAGNPLQPPFPPDSEDSWRVSHDAVLDDVVYLRIDGAGLLEDEFAYHVAVSLAVPPDCDDGYEPNETLAQARPVAPDATLQAVLCDTSDVDVFSVLLAAGGDLRATLSHDSAQGDADLELLQSDGALLASAATSEPVEVVAMSNLQAGVYLLRVFAFDGMPMSRMAYTLQVAADVPDAGVEDAAQIDVGGVEDGGSGEDAAPTVDAGSAEDAATDEDGGSEDAA